MVGHAGLGVEDSYAFRFLLFTLFACDNGKVAPTSVHSCTPCASSCALLAQFWLVGIEREFQPD